MTTAGRRVAHEANAGLHRERWAALGAARQTLRTIVHVTAEYYPYARTGGLAEAVAGLANSQADAGRDVMVFLPLYPAVRDAAPDLAPLAPPQEISVGAHTEQVQFFQRALQGPGPRLVFIDAPRLFARPGLYGEDGADYPDNHVRFAIFSRAAVEGVRQFVTGRAVVHAHDWHAAFAPVFLRAVGTPLDDTPVVMSVHNAGFQGHFSEAVMTDLGLPWELWNLHHFEWYGQFNVLKGGMSFCDAVATVSPSHAEELRTAEGGFGLHDAFTMLGPRLVGVCNGIDQRAWNPATDPGIARRFTTQHLEGKAACKDELQRSFGLARRPEVPLFGICARLTRQKGFDLMLTSQRLRTVDAQFVFLGTGDAYYQRALTALKDARPDQVAVEFGFTDEREHRLMAGADVALVPSLYEPCGLSQMHAQRYGTLVIGRRTGGLHDTVRDGQTGFLFDEYSTAAFDAAIDRALATFANATEWQRMMRCAMRVDFGWGSAARRYLELYDAAERRTRESEK